MKKWRPEEYEFTPEASTVILTGENWRGKYDKMPMDSLLPLVISEFLKSKDIYNREYEYLEEHLIRAAKDRAHFKMLDIAEDIVFLDNYCYTKKLRKPGSMLQKRISELEHQVDQEIISSQKSRELVDEAEKSLQYKDNLIKQINKKLTETTEQSEMFVNYGRSLSPRFVQEAEEFARKKNNESVVHASDGDEDDE